MRSFWLASLLIPAIAFGQSDDTAQRIYKSSQDSVFLVYLNDSSGSPTALGSAFLVAKRTLVTNAHVADAGSPVLAVGPVRIPLKVVRIDRKNDLAILSVDVDLTSSPLTLATGTVSPGEQIFAIGNPEGLEKTISQGIVSGLRNENDRKLLQITSPISHGSSGGPILNARGEVVGVAVGTLEDGQNLNFAVPVAYVRSIIESKHDTLAPLNPKEGITEAQAILQNRGTFSNEPASEYQRKSKRLNDLVGALVSQASSESDLRELACIGTTTVDLSDSGIRAARRLSQINPSPANRALLAYVLYDRAQNEHWVAQLAQKDSKEMTDAIATNGRFLSEAAREAGDVIRRAKGDDVLIASFVLGNVKRDQKSYSEAIPLHLPVTSKAITLCGSDLRQQASQSLVSESDEAKHPDEAEKWFRYYANIYTPAAYEWDQEGNRRANAGDNKNAADAYERAAASSTYYGYDYCYASNGFRAVPSQPQDRVLDDGKKCIDASLNSNKENETVFKTVLPIVYSHMSDILNERGVYAQALEYAKESLSLQPNDAFALDAEAHSFSGLDRNSECIAAENAAIRASDGKYAWMHFRLGICYFASENWSQAANSFRLAAESDKTNAVAAFDLALSLSRQGFGADARVWFREALNRKPDAETRDKSLEALK